MTAEPRNHAPSGTRRRPRRGRCCGLILAVAAGLLFCGLQPPGADAAEAAQADDATEATDADGPPLTLVVMDPLAAPLACDCVKGYAQRKYELLAMFLENWLSHKVELIFSEALERGIAKSSRGSADLVIGKHSLVNFDATECKLPVRPLAMLTGKDGKTTLTGLFVVPGADPAKKIGDLEGYRILFGLPEAAEKHAAAVAALKKAGVSVPDPKETFPSCAEAGLAAMESDAVPGTAAVISSYAMALLEGCGTIDKGDLRVIGETDPLPFVTVFATGSVDEKEAEKIVEALLAMRQIPPLLTAMETKLGFVRWAENENAPKTEAPPEPAPAAGQPGEGAAPGPSASGAPAGGEWPQWRGPGRNGVVPWLPERLPAEPNVLWRTELTGAGLSGIAVSAGRVIVADRDPTDRIDVFRCLKADSGEELWTHQYPAMGDLDYGNSPRATPLVHGGLVYLLGAFGDLSCVKLADGSLVWQKSFTRDFGAKPPTWGWSSSPLVVDGKLIVNPGAEAASLAALDPKTGAVLWQTPGKGAAYASFIVGTFGGVRQIVGYDAISLGGWDPATGRRLWVLLPPFSGDFNVPTPVELDGRLIAATENNGTRLYGFDDRGVIQPKALAEHEDLAPDTTTPVLAGGRLFGAWGDLFCLDPSDGLAEQWTGADDAFEDHVSLLTDGHRLLVTSAAGELLLIDLTGNDYRLISRLPLFGDDAEVLSHPALVDRKLYLRDSRSVICVALE